MEPAGEESNLGTGASCGFMLALRSLRTGAGSKVGRPVAEVVVVQVDETLLSKPGGKLLLRRWKEYSVYHNHIVVHSLLCKTRERSKKKGTADKTVQAEFRLLLSGNGKPDMGVEMRKAPSSKPSLVFTGKSQEVRDRSKLGHTATTRFSALHRKALPQCSEMAGRKPWKLRKDELRPNPSCHTYLGNGQFVFLQALLRIRAGILVEGYSGVQSGLVDGLEGELGAEQVAYSPQRCAHIRRQGRVCKEVGNETMGLSHHGNIHGDVGS